MWYSFLYLKFVKIHFHKVPIWSTLVCKMPEFRRWKLWDQNFVPFNSGNIHIKESKKKTGFTFSIQLRNKFVWSHGLRCLTGFWIRFCIARKHLIKIVWHYIIIFPFQLYLSFIASCSQEKGYLLIYQLTY